MTTLTFKKRISISEAFNTPDKEVELAGWAKNVRALGKIKFI